MADRLVQIADGFWNVRGSFKVAGLLDVGTQMSLVRRQSGDFILLDSYTLRGEVQQQLLALTEQGRAIHAVLNLHPFHTLHVRATAAQFPQAKLYGTRRHVARAPELRWEPEWTEDSALHALFAQDLRFSVPRGVDFVPSNEQLHFASVLALHSASGTLHVDDTLSWLNVPLVGGLKFHPTLRQVLQKRPGAVSEFRDWTRELIELCGDAKHLCTAHGKSLPPTPAGQSIQSMVMKAVEGLGPLLAAREKQYG